MNDPAPDAVVLIAVLITAVVVLVITIGLMALVSYFVYKPLTKVPEAHREMSPPMAFLLMIPVFGIFWAFMIALKVPASLKSYFDSAGNAAVGDCGKNIGLAWAICSAASLIPFLGAFTGLAALVLLIIFLVKINSLAGQIQQNAVVSR